MAGLFGASPLAAPSLPQQQAPNWSSRLGLFGAALQDAGAGFNGQPTGQHVVQYQRLMQQQLAQQAVRDASSPDPAVRQRAYATLSGLGVDTSSLRQNAAAAAAPQLLDTLQNGRQMNSAESAKYQGAGALPNLPVSGIGDALSAVGSPELSAQYAPQLIAQSIAQNTPKIENVGGHLVKYAPNASGPQDVQTLYDAPIKPNPNQPFNADGTPNKAYQEYEAKKQQAAQALGWANLAESQRHNRVAESNQAQNSEFGRGMTGKAYATLAKGLKDPALATTPEYATAYQILARPHVDPNTGTIVTPDLSLYPRPVIGGRQTQAPMPTVTAFAPPNPSQAEAASAGFANRLAASADIIAKNESPLTSLKQRTESKIPVIGNYLVSPEYQKADQAERDFVNAQLRRESGAVISDQEFDNARKQYFPQPGDSKAVLEQKRVARQRAVRNMQLSAGNSLLPPGVYQTASPPRGAPMVPQQQGFGASSAPAAAPRKSVRWEDLP